MRSCGSFRPDACGEPHHYRCVEHWLLAFAGHTATQSRRYHRAVGATQYARHPCVNERCAKSACPIRFFSLRIKLSMSERNVLLLLSACYVAVFAIVLL